MSLSKTADDTKSESMSGAGHSALAWQALQQHCADVTRRKSPQSVTYLAPSVLRRTGDVRLAAELLQWTEREQGAPGLPEARKAADAIAINAHLVRHALPQVRRWALTAH